jgi:hypothetical protein
LIIAENPFVYGLSFDCKANGANSLYPFPNCARVFVAIRRTGCMRVFVVIRVGAHGNAPLRA